MSNITNNIIMNMSVMNMIKDEDYMEWTTRDNQYVFEISRSDNMVYYSNSGGSYIITIKIRDRLSGIYLFELRFNEIDAVRVLDTIDIFVNGMDKQTYSSVYINTAPMDATGMYPVIYLFRDYINDIGEEEEVADVLFEIRQYSPIHETMITIFKIMVTDEELSNLMFAIFFTTLLDIDLPIECEHQIEHVVQNLVSNGYLNSGDYNNNGYIPVL